MSPDTSSRAAELAAQQVEAIVSAAQKAADQIRAEAERKAAEQRSFHELLQRALEAKRLRHDEEEDER